MAANIRHVNVPMNGETLLTGPVVDQAALHGLLKKVRDKEIKNEYDQIKSPLDKPKDRNRRSRLIDTKINHNKEIKK